MSESIKNRIFRQLTNRLDPVIANIVDVEHSEVACGKGLCIRRMETPEIIREGQLIFEEFPIWPTAIAFFRHQDQYCYNCMRRLHGIFLPCSVETCNVKYCNKQCQDMSNDLSHAALCVGRNTNYASYHKIAEDSENEYYVVAARLLWMFPNAPWKFHYHSPQWSDKETDVDHMSLKDELDMMSRLLRVAFRQLNGSDTDLITPEALSRTIGFLRVNVLGLRHDEQDMGFALYPTQSLINHSDSPNCRCVTVFGEENPDSPCLCGIQALRDIEPGEELFIDYIGNVGKREREITLRLQYGIDTSQE